MRYILFLDAKSVFFHENFLFDVYSLSVRIHSNKTMFVDVKIIKHMCIAEPTICYYYFDKKLEKYRQTS